MKASQKTPLYIPLVLVVLGIAVLLNNYMLIDAEVLRLAPLLLIGLGLMILWRGDIALSWQAHSFGITRGSVESASLEINSAEIDMRVRSLRRTGRLIAGQYTARSRPRLMVRNNHARLTMNRADTWLFSMADWEAEIAPDLPWSLLLSAHLGEIEADLRGLQLKQAHLATGIGNLKVVSPDQPAGPVYLRSTFGDVQLTIPRGVPALIRVQVSPFCRVIPKGRGFEAGEKGAFYTTPAYQPENPALEITVSATFGNILLYMA